ncbi:radical SAM protein [Candidatus Woesearchaeota archaeon]|nr:MAG: radical SAM protein [Candidatus Woesearchaeota archaeon]
MKRAILDCYTDEPSGLGVPPYLGVYPRYIYGRIKPAYYLTIDDLRSWKKKKKQSSKPSQKTDISVYNTTKNSQDVQKILESISELIIILGVHTPGKYLSAIPGTLREVINLTRGFKCKKVLTGPAVSGTQLEGGKFFERVNENEFDEMRDYNFDFNDLKAREGASVIKQINDLRIIEIETSRGCPGKCSFCLEPVKHKYVRFRKPDFIINEIKELYNLGCRHFRLGKQSCFYSYPWLEELLKVIWQECPEIKVLHIDNVNPNSVTDEKTELIVKYCTPGNVAAFGVESFDTKVIEANNLNTTPEQTMKAIRIINKHGRKIGSNGMPKFLPGINILFGLKEESKETHNENMRWLNKIYKENLLLRRINIRQVNIYPGTDLQRTAGNKYLKKNRKYYWKWRNEIRQKIDWPMLRKIIPEGTILKEVRTEVYDGKTTFGRQLGTYPIIVGIKKRLPLKSFFNVKIKSHMLRSVVGEVV